MTERPPKRIIQENTYFGHACRRILQACEECGGLKEYIEYEELFKEAFLMQDGFWTALPWLEEVGALRRRGKCDLAMKMNKDFAGSWHSLNAYIGAE